MLGFLVGVLTVVMVLGSAGYAVAEVYRLIRRKVSKKAARPEVTTGEPVSGLMELISSGVPRESAEPPPESAELHTDTGRDGASATRPDMRRHLRRYNIKYALHAILGGLLWLGILAGLIWLSVRWELFRNALITFILRFPWLLAGFIAGVILEGREAKSAELHKPEPPTKGTAKPIPTSVTALVLVVATACAGALWMERYRFEQIDLENGESYPVRINRVTGNSEVLYQGVWKAAAELPTLPPLIQDLGAQDLEKLKGEANPHGELYSKLGLFYISLYNGSGFRLKEITVEITIRAPHGEELLSRVYRIEPHLKQDHLPKQQTGYLQDLGFNIGPEQTCSWKITAARGIRSLR